MAVIAMTREMATLGRDVAAGLAERLGLARRQRARIALHGRGNPRPCRQRQRVDQRMGSNVSSSHCAARGLCSHLRAYGRP
jgi:hypothetical protein